jgi:hypothetical protein
MRPFVGKLRTREHFIADMSICFVEWQALKCGYTIERMRHDYGIDLELKTYNKDGEREPGDISIQVKATDGLILRKGQTAFGFRIERSHLLWWLSEFEPVLLIVFDAKAQRAYWLCIQGYFAALENFNFFAAGKTITVQVPIRNRLNSRAMRGFARLRDQYRNKSRSPGDD